MIKIERTSDGGNWIASIARRRTVVQPGRIADMVLVEVRGKTQIGVAAKDEVLEKDLRSAINVLTSGDFPDATCVTADSGKINVSMPVVVESKKSAPKDKKP